MSEFHWISWLQPTLAAHEQRMRLTGGVTPWPSADHGRLITAPGDDTAVMHVGHGDLLLAADMLMDGVHFDLGTTPPHLVGRKALAVNLSDLAAMAGAPESATVCLALPKAGGEELAKALYSGLLPLAEEYGLTIAGGDTNAWDGPLVISVAITGRAHTRGSVRRSGAVAGDWICVTGTLGGSILGHHLSFTPRLREAWQLHRDYGLHAMLDLSDGLAGDLRHILRASGVGARLDAAALPISQAARRLAAGQPDPVDAARQHALNDGEDFELCFTLPEAAAQRLLAAQPLPGVSISKIGEVTAAKGLVWQGGSAVAAGGWQHMF